MSPPQPDSPPPGPPIRVRLMETAARLLAEEGPGALSTRRLAAEIGASTMAVYTHFGGMPELVRAVVREGFARLADHLAKVPRTEDPMADLAGLGVAYRANALANPHLYAVMFGTASLGGYRLSDEELAEGRYTFDILVEATRRAMEAGRLRPGDPFLVASQLWSALHGFVMLELAGYVGHDGGRAAKHVLGPLMSNLLAGLGDDPAARPSTPHAPEKPA